MLHEELTPRDNDAPHANTHNEATNAHDSSRPKSTRVQFPEEVKAHPVGTPGIVEPCHYPLTREDTVQSGYASSIGTDDGEDSEEYDWSDEEDLVDEAAKFENQKMGGVSKKHRWTFKGIFSLLFTSLIGSIVLAGILVTPALVVHFHWYKPDPTPTRQYIKDNTEAWLFWAAANLIISWFLAMIIDIIPIVLRFFLSATWGHVSEYVKTRIETYDSVKDTVKPAFYAGSAYASWVIIFAEIYELYNDANPDESRAGYTQHMANVVQFFFFLVVIWCAQRMLSHFIAFSFHRTAYKERIEEVEKALYVIEKLREYRPKPQSGHQNNKSSGVRTPALGALGFRPEFSEKQHFRALSGALKNVSGRTITTDDGHDGDVENHDNEGDRTLVASAKRRPSKLRNRLSWFNDTPGESSNQKATDYFQMQEKPQKNKDNEKSKEGNGSLPNENEEKSNSGTPNASDLGGIRPSHVRKVSDPVLLTHSRQAPGSAANTTGLFSPLPSTDASDLYLRQAAKVFKHAVMHDARNLSGKAGALGGLAWNVNSAHEAKRLARSIFMRFKAPGRTWLVPSDFYPAYLDQTAAAEAFKVFDKDDNGDITRGEIKTTLLKVYKERRFLSRSMRDVSQALTTLDRILMFFAAVILFFISLSVFGVQISASLSSIYSLGVAASFIFRNSASSAFDAIMFLFVTHPYDTGDRVFVDQENLVVKKVGLFATVFQGSDGKDTYYFNSQLFTKFITNVRRSGNTWENLSMQVAWTTPLTKLDALEKSLNEWLSTEENRWFEPSTNITLQHVKYQRYLELTIGIGHNGNWQDWGLRQARKTAFHTAVHYYSRVLGIVGWEAPLPIVYADPKTMTYRPSSDQLDDILSPTTPAPLSDPSPEKLMRLEKEEREDEKVARDMKPTLGFLPPLVVRSSQLAKARKSRHKKANLGAGNAS